MIKAFLEQYLLVFGPPKVVVTDRGTCYTSAQWKKLMDAYSIRHILGLPSIKQITGVIERSFRTLEARISHYISDTEADWDIYLPFCVSAYNNQEHAANGLKPFELMMGRQPRLSVDNRWDTPFGSYAEDPESYLTQVRIASEELKIEAKKNLSLAELRNNKVQRIQKMVMEKDVQPGDVIYVNTCRQKTKLTRKQLDGPYTVLEVNKPTVVYKDERNKRREAHVDNVRIFQKGGKTESPPEHGPSEETMENPTTSEEKEEDTRCPGNGTTPTREPSDSNLSERPLRRSTRIRKPVRRD